MVACWIVRGDAEFHQTVDFLSICSINYALTVSPTIYASYIEQFWNTAPSKTINSVKQIHAIVNGKVVVILESLVRSDLLFNDEDGIVYLTNNENFENLALIGYEQLSTKLTFQKDLLEPFNDTYETPTHSKKVFSNMARKSKKFSGKVTLLFDNMLVQTQVPEGKGSALPPEPQPTPFTSQLNVLEPQTESLQNETPPTVSHELHTAAHIQQILPSPSTYQRKTKKDQKHGCKKVTELLPTSVPLDIEHMWLFNKEGEDASKNREADDKTKPMFVDSDFDELDDDMENVKGEIVNTTTTGVSAVSAPVTTAGVAISNTEPRTPPTTTATAFIDEDLTIAQTLVKMRSEKAKVKGIAFSDVEEAPKLKRLTTTLQPLLTIDPKDKGKGVLVEEEPEKPEKVKRRDQGLAQIESDAELAQRLHEEELAELHRAQKERQKHKEATSAALAKEFDEI
ncbi:hypothetical protein Tco_0818078 [Tanacetum coccineum]